MMMKKRMCVVLAMFAGMSVTQSLAGDEKADTKSKREAAKVLDRYIEVTGGKSAYEAVRNRVMKGTMELVEMSIKGPMTSYASAPNLSYTEMELMGMGKMRRGSDGKVIWDINPMRGARIMKGEEAEFAERETIFNAELQWRKIYPTVENLGEEKEGETSYYKIKLTPKSGPAMTHFYNVDTGLLDKMKFTAATQMGDIPVEVFIEDYRKIGDLLISHKTTQKVAGQTMRITMESIELNAKLAPDRFALPDEIKALVSKDASSKSKAAEKSSE